MAAVVAVGYAFGHTLERYTTLNPVIGMTLIGALYRNLGTDNYLNNPNADALDFHLRRIYPVIILSKGPLSWNWEYIKYNSVKVFSLATLPWIVECMSTAVFTHVLLKYPWYWGLHLGAILSSVSPAVIVPSAMAFHARGLGTKNQVAALVANAGGLDTAFTEGMFGVINSAIFLSSPLSYKIVKVDPAAFCAECQIQFRDMYLYRVHMRSNKHADASDLWVSGSSRSGVSLGAHLVCARVGLTDKQRAMCRATPAAIAAVGDGLLH